MSIYLPIVAIVLYLSYNVYCIYASPRGLSLSYMYIFIYIHISKKSIQDNKKYVHIYLSIFLFLCINIFINYIFYINITHLIINPVVFTCLMGREAYPGDKLVVSLSSLSIFSIFLSTYYLSIRF